MIDFLMKHAQWLIFIGAFISMLGGLLSSIQTNKDAAVFERKLDEANTGVQLINNETTGGDSFPFLNIEIYDEGEEIKFKLYNYGKIKLNNVRMEIVDGAKMGNSINPAVPIDYDTEQEKYTTTTNYDILYANKSLPIKDFKIDERFKDICLTVHFDFGNRHLVEAIIFYDYKIPDLRRGYVKIFDGSKVLLHYTIDKDFQRTYIVGFNT